MPAPPTSAPGTTLVPGTTSAPPAGPSTAAPPATATLSPTAEPPSGGTSAPATPASPAAPPALRPGDSGPRVLELQNRLSAAGYWLGTPDGTYGQLTQQAVLALQKAAGAQRDGLAGPATWRALDAGVRPSARSTQGRALEVDLARQLVLVAQDGKVQQIFNTSTGSNTYYVSGGVRKLAVTPEGTYKIFRQVNGVDPGPLGSLYRPKYFNGGIAFHGYSSVPAYPASHGCVRLSNPAMDWMWSSGVAEIGAAVHVY
ncbi:murein L,D-transpeptidase [Frankia sp. CN6]|uniref:Murein L,D-transpeptidase n=1 Tax=Frankia nepalensis TaxID=1836974 RepID=A0A937RUE2_9ACTN|nr:murein L,D-transpeptidase [Frankia nepalensis]